jgi:acyl-CoA thioesterase I
MRGVVARRRNQVIIGGLLLIGIIWALWPWRWSNVANLDSHGSAIVALGDSLTAGYGAVAGEDYPDQLAKRIGSPVLNAGVSGDTTAAALARLETDVLSRDPRIVIIGLGANDYLRGSPISATEASLRTVIQRIRGAGAMVVLLGFRFPGFNANYEAMYARVAKEERALLIPDLLHGILTDPALKSDEIHPNGRGYGLMAERIAGPLKKLISHANDKR